MQDRLANPFSALFAVTEGPIGRLFVLLAKSGCVGLVAAAVGISACAGPARSGPAAASQVAPADSAAVASTPAPALSSAADDSSRAPNPYAPTCITPLHQYAWQNPKHTPCNRSAALTEPATTYTAEVKLSFFDSVAAFPLLTDDVEGIVPPKPQADGAPPESVGASRRDPNFVVASLRPRLRSCFSSLLERSEQAEGSIRFALSLGCAGEVQTISAKAEGVDEPTIECLFAVVAPAMFDPPAGGHATIQVPVVFKNSAR